MKLWREVKAQLQNRLAPFEVFMTEYPRHATELAKDLSEKSYERLIVMGGDGSLHEVLNGLFDESGKMIQHQIKIGIMNSGRGCDFARTLGIPVGYGQNINMLVDSKTKAIDVGKVTFKNSTGTHVEYFLNSFSYLLGGEVCKRVTRAKTILPPTMMYFTASLMGLMSASSQKLEISVDGGESFTKEFLNIFVMNGKFSGGGMEWAPNAKIDDGLLDVVFVEKMSKLKLGFLSSKIYDGTFSEIPGVEYKQASSLKVRASGVFSMELDGEISESSEFQIEILNKTLQFIC